MNIKEKLKEALKLAGLNEGLANVITIASEEEIEGIINQLKPEENNELDFNKILSSESFNAFIGEKGFDKVLEVSKKLQSEHDKKVTAGIKSFKEKYFKDDGTEEGQDEKKKEMSDDTPQWAKDLISKVESFEKKEQTSSRSIQLKELLSKSKLPIKLREKWLSRVNLESDTSLEEQIKSLEQEAEELRTDFIGSSVGSGLPVGGRSEGKMAEADIQNVVNNLM